MINKLLALLHSPYPVLVKRWKAVVIPSFIVFIILYLLQPFGISMIENNKIWIVLGYGIISSLALSVSVYLLPAVFPWCHDEQHWTLGKELLETLGACLLIAIGNWFYTVWCFGGDILSWRGFFVCLFWVGILSPFPVVVFLMWNRNLQLARNLKEATEINFALSKKMSIRRGTGEAEAGENTEAEGKAGAGTRGNAETEGVETGTREKAETGENTEVRGRATEAAEAGEKENVCCPLTEKPVNLVFSGGTKEMLEIPANALLYVEAEGNYVRVIYRGESKTSENKMQQMLLRATMKQAEEAVAACLFIVRCHRAFLVNVNAVVKVDGNSQGYRLRLEGCKSEVPVSRAYSKEVKMLIEGGSEI
ncbi:LytTR family DNA-binding domain-containing protein [Bacteroides sp. UBA939]|uniref:LytTR family DNA-binding domain-containing protein n=1 Tax=Bacteroides sp. UBA939 TaxID=1946092 RepID=UPI0025BA42B3|nr:LytTR family DNA-binding domain-containing protein [Bacteroides sp. UBA939]